MDIVSPKVENWVSPAPHWIAAQRSDKRGLVRELARMHPEAGPDEIAALCAKWGLQVSGILVARIVQAVRAEESSN
jgi:hypothetical protein